VACPECAVLHLALGDIVIGNHQWDAAEEEYKLAVEQDPALFEARTRLADLACHRGQDDVLAARVEAFMSDETPAAERITFATWSSQCMYMHGKVGSGRALLARGLEVAKRYDPARAVRIASVRADLEASVRDAAGVRGPLSLGLSSVG